MPVVATLELHHLRPSRERPGQADGTHGGLGTRVDQPNQLEGRHRLHEYLGHAHLVLRGNAERGPSTCCVDGCAHDLFTRVSEEEGTPRLDVINEPTFVDVDQFRSLAPERKDRSAAHGAECPYRRVHTTGDEAECLGEQLV